MLITVSEKGQMVIPAVVRRLLGISPGTRLNLLPEAGGFRVLVDDARKTTSAADCIGVSNYKGPVVAVAQMDVAKFASKA